MDIGFPCIECLLRMEFGHIRDRADKQARLACAKELLAALAGAPAGVSPPEIVPALDAICAKYFDTGADPQRALKERSGKIMLERLPDIRKAVFSVADPLYAALQYSRIGNYIDFASFGDCVDFHRLDELLASARTYPIEETEYRRFREDLRCGSSLLLLTDNAGEIVLDRLLLEALRQEYPALELTVCVRGGPALNDALREDAEAAGIPALARLIDSGAAISGTSIRRLGSEARQAMETASVILSKGQGNLETLLGCGRNIYYLFLCKCAQFTEMFHVPAMTGMFLNEQRMPAENFR